MYTYLPILMYTSLHTTLIIQLPAQNIFRNLIANQQTHTPPATATAADTTAVIKPNRYALRSL